MASDVESTQEIRWWATMIRRWWQTRDLVEMDPGERNRFSFLYGLDPREKLAEARSIVEQSRQAMGEGDYPLYNEFLAESKALEDWAERELQGLPY